MTGRELFSSVLGSRVFILYHPVANANLSKDIFGLGRVFFNLPADIGHIDPKDLVIIVHVRPPDGVHDGAIGQDLAGIFC